MAQKNPAKIVFDVLSPEGQTERLTFRKYAGSKLAQAAEGGSPPNPDVIVVLKVNPESISYAKPKITQKVQTASPNRFVIFDWGTDLTVMSISGNTGNLLPDIIQGGFNPLQPTFDDLAAKIAPGKQAGGVSNIISGVTAAHVAPVETGILAAAGGSVTPGAVKALAQQVLMGKLSYFELIGMSPKYKTFMRLQELYENFDADQDVLTLELGESIFRGYFLDFSFTQEANSPWNWKYSIVFSALQDLTKFSRRGDDTFKENKFFG